MNVEELKQYYNEEYNYAIDHLPQIHKKCIYCDSIVLLNDKSEDYYCPNCMMELDNTEIKEEEYDNLEFQNLIINLINTLYNYEPLNAEKLFNETANLCKEFNDYTNDCQNCPLAKSNNGFNISCKDLIIQHPSRYEGLVRNWINRDYKNGIDYIRTLIHNKKELKEYSTNKFNRQFGSMELNNLKKQVAKNKIMNS